MVYVTSFYSKRSSEGKHGGRQTFPQEMSRAFSFDKVTNQGILYCLGLALQNCPGIRLFVAMFMSNHSHLVYEDKHGDAPKFTMELNRNIARFMQSALPQESAEDAAGLFRRKMPGASIAISSGRRISGATTRQACLNSGIQTIPS